MEELIIPAYFYKEDMDDDTFLVPATTQNDKHHETFTWNWMMHMPSSMHMRLKGILVLFILFFLLMLLTL